MNRLQSELQRLYLPPTPSDPDLVRGAILSLAGPADWTALSRVWRGVQSDLGLPAPAIAVSGVDAYQLWFSFAQPLSATQARAFVEGLRGRYLGEIAAARIGMQPLDAAAAQALPPRQVASGQWSAFVAPDLAPVFADEPSLDTEPGADGQADLLARLQSMRGADLQAALAQMDADVGVGPAAQPAAADDAVPAVPAVPADQASQASQASHEARSFLRRLMHDETVALALRIEAAKALLG